MLPDPPEYQPDEESYAERWFRVFTSRHSCFGAWRGYPDGGCGCGRTFGAFSRLVPQAERTAA